MTWRHVGVLTLALALVLGVVYTLTHSRPLSDREQIVQMIEDGKRAVESKSARRAMSYVAEDYSDDAGNNYRLLQRLANQVLTGARRIQVTLPVVEIHFLQPPRAVVRVAGVVAFEDQGFREQQDFDLFLHLVKRSGAWKVQRIEGMATATGLE